MPEVTYSPKATITEEIMLARLAQSEQIREFFIQMWLQNPQLVRRAGRKVQEMLSPVQVAARSE